jgi:lipopolysaccharide export system protein LptC
MSRGEPEWKVTAETGVLNTDDNVILRDKVHLDGCCPPPSSPRWIPPIWSWIW